MKSSHQQTIFLVLGVFLFLFLLYKMDLRELWHQLENVHLSYLFFLLAYTFLWRFCHALAFFILCGVKGAKLGSYVVTQILSNTVSDLFLVGNTGGEIYRAYKMSSYYPEAQRTFWGMTLMYNVYYAFAMMLVFLTSGIYLSYILEFSTALKVGFLLVILTCFFLSCLLVFWQSRGMLSQVVGIFGKFPFPWTKKISQYLIKKTIPIDRVIKDHHKKEPGRTFLFIFLMYTSRMLTIGESLIIALTMGISIGFSQAVLINMVDSFVRIAFFLIPNGQLGVIEAAMVSLGKILGQSPTTMFGFSLIQRVRVLFWDGIGIVIMLWEKKRGKLYESSLDA